MEALAADHLVHRNCSPPATRPAPSGVGHLRPLPQDLTRIGALEVDRQRDLDGPNDPAGIGKREVQWDILAVGPAIRIGHRIAARCERLRAPAAMTASALPTSQML